MTLDRRNFMKAALGGTAAATVAVALPPNKAQARDNKSMPPKAVGLLFDSTLCIGCKACVNSCKDANGMPAEFSTPDKLWDTPLDLSGKTLNVIKSYAEGTSDVKDREGNGYAFVKKSCLHCVDPSCVSACPVTAMTKDPESGIVSYDADKCIGCRYCVAACPFGVPRFQYDTATPRIQKCQLCKQHLASTDAERKYKFAACAQVCPTGATLFGPVELLKAEAQRRLELEAGSAAVYPRGQIETPFPAHEKPAPDYKKRIYGDKEIGGTQMLLLAGVSFGKLGYPDLPEQSYAAKSESLQHSLYGGMILPLVALAGLAFAIKRTAGAHKNEEGE
ncbi:hydrogenase 2 4Fe-4S ferredoxin-type component [Rhodospirillaceae bacterium LM-1]|nr:hydrogenase 2 4Fe-4S ferredoxin-type component [Rhodospirillaceae bacterium LM-1]